MNEITAENQSAVAINRTATAQLAYQIASVTRMYLVVRVAFLYHVRRR